MSSRVVIRQRLRLLECTLEQAMPPDGPLRFRVTSFGVLHVTDSRTGKRDGDVTVFPWHQVVSLDTWREVVPAPRAETMRADLRS